MSGFEGIAETEGSDALAPFDLSLTPAQHADLIAYRDLLSTWNGRMNLVGPSAMGEFWTRHVADSAQLLRLAPRARRFADIGTGAGLPGVVLAILLKPDPDAQVHLVESVAKRCAFLREAVTTLALPAVVHHARAEDLKLTPTIEVVTARAVAPLSRLLSYARPMMKPGVRALFLKGRGAEAEVAEAKSAWSFKAVSHPSLTDPDARILEITGLSRA